MVYLFAAVFEDPKIGISGKGLIKVLYTTSDWLIYLVYSAIICVSFKFRKP